MTPRLFMTKVGRCFVQRFPTPRTKQWVCNHFRKICVQDEILTWTQGNFLMRVSPHDYVSHRIFFWGEYDPVMSSMMKAHITEGSVCWDVGTERGWFSLLMGRLVGPGGRVDGFEAFPPNFKKLQENIELNNFHWVHPHNLAVSDHAERMFFVPPSNEVTNHSGLEDCNNGVGYLTSDNSPGSIEVSTCTLDEQASEMKLDRLDFIKIDIEGAEVAALRGARETIIRFQPKIAVEYNRKAALRARTSMQELDDLLEGYGYDRYVYEGCLKKVQLKKWKGDSDEEAVFNVYCYPRR
jgi:FkbM family methyltransferase